MRAFFAVLLSSILLWCAWLSLRAGASRMISDYAVRAELPSAADESVALTPGDPEALYAKANMLADAGDYDKAARSYREALALRPRDYVMWVELGRASDESGDVEGTLDAFRKATALAPFYSQPRWQLGNALLRAGRKQEALDELRRATDSDPRLFPNFVQTLWYAGGHDPRVLAREAQPQTLAQTLVLVRFLIKSASADAGVKALRESSMELTQEARRTLVADLLAVEDYASAYDVWADGHAKAVRGGIYDSEFEETTRTDDEGFGWRFEREQAALKFSLDKDEPRQGSRSLRVDFSGGSDPAASIISQLVLVEPAARYRLGFSARTRDLVTGGLPFIELVSAGKGAVALASSPSLSSEASKWRDYAVEFIAPAGTRAVKVSLRRQSCSGSPCPAFGSIWLDAFELKKL